MMSKDLVLQLRYLGVIPQRGHREYGFTIEDKDKRVRRIILTIDDSFFLQNQLMFQEAPDLCYQKLLADISNETADAPISSRASVTISEIAGYRIAHPIGRPRNKYGAKRPAKPSPNPSSAHSSGNKVSGYSFSNSE